jgi:nucleoside-diphosphate-sugar epimerase
MTSVLVMGGSRFVGLHTVSALLRGGYQVTTLNRGTSEQPSGVKHLNCDRKDLPRLKALLEKKEFSAVVDITASEPEETLAMSDIFQGRIERFVHCSTGAVYEDRWEFPVFEEDPLVSWTGERTYPESKAQCERILFKAYEEHSFPVTILRPTVIYGPHNYLYREAYVFDRAEARKPIPVPGDGKSVTHVVHVDDVANAFAGALRSHASIGEAYNIAGPRAVSLNVWAELAAKPCTDDVRIIHYDESLVGRDVKGGFPLSTNPWVMSIEKARRDLGFNPRGLYDGMKDAYEWYSRSHPFGSPDFQFDRAVASSQRTKKAD